MSNNTILDQYKNGQLTEQQEEAFEATLLKATFAYQEEQALLRTFAQWRNQEVEKKGKSRHLYIYGVAASFLFLVVAISIYTLYLSKPEQANTAASIAEKPVEQIVIQKDTPTSSPIIQSSTSHPKRVRVAPTPPQKIDERPKANNDTPPQYLAQNDAIFAEIDAIFSETAMDMGSNTKMGVDNMDSLRHIGKAYFSNKEYTKYMLTINQLDKDKISSTDYLFLGESCLHLKDNKGAIDNFKQAEKDPDNEPDIRTLHLALAYIRDRQLDNARKTLKILTDSKTSNFKGTAIKLLGNLK